MATTFKAVQNLYAAYYYDDSAGTYTRRGGSNTVASDDIFSDTAAVGDCIVFQQNLSGRTKKYGRIDFDIGTALAATSITGVWEYGKRVSSSVASWHTLQNVRDDTNAFQNTGANSVYFEIPYDWENYYNLGFVTIWYSYQVRFRITAISGLTEGGAFGATGAQVEGRMINIDTGADTSFQELYEADKAGTVDLHTRTGVTATDAGAITVDEVARPADYRVLGGARNDLYITTTNYSGGGSVTVRLTGTDIGDAAQTEDIVITANGTSYATKYFKTLTATHVTAHTATTLDYTLTQGQWGVVSKPMDYDETYNRQYYIEADLTSEDGSKIISKNEQIMFGRNWQVFNMYGGMQVGQIYKSKTYDGSNFVFHPANTSMTGYSTFSSNFGVDTFYNTQIKAVGEGVFHGFWVSPGAYDTDNLNDFFCQGFRQYNFNNEENVVIGARAWNMRVEPTLAINDGVILYGDSENVGHRFYTTIPGAIVHRSDLSGVHERPVNAYRVYDTDGWYVHTYDCIFPDTSDVSQTDWFYWNGVTPTYTNAKGYQSNSFLLQVIDSFGNAIEGATIIVKNTQGDIVHESVSSEDGYANLDKGTASSGAVDALNDTSQSWTVTASAGDPVDEWWRREIFITGGTGKGQKRICKYGHTATSQNPHYDFNTAPDNTSRYIIIPYLNVFTYVPTEYTTANRSSDYTAHSPFTIEVTASGYKDEKLVLEVDGPVNEKVVLKNRRYPRR